MRPAPRTYIHIYIRTYIPRQRWNYMVRGFVPSILPTRGAFREAQTQVLQFAGVIIQIEMNRDFIYMYCIEEIIFNLWLLWRKLITVMSCIVLLSYWVIIFLRGCTTGGSSRRAQLRKYWVIIREQGMNCLRSLESWDRGFEFHLRRGCLCAFMLCVDNGLATGWSTVQWVLPTVYMIKKLKRRPSNKRTAVP
jgi:hypothetical protein